MGKTVLFSRCSTVSQDLEQQTAALYSAVKCKKSDVIEISDHESGIQLNFEEREGINELIRTIDTQQVDRIIIYEISRLARRADVFYKVRDILINKHIQLQCLNPSFELLNEDGSINENSNLLIGIFLSMAESEMRIKKARFKRGKLKAKEEGRNYGFKNKYGYTTDKHHKCIVKEEEATVVRKVFDWYINGKSSYSIANELIDAGYLHTYKEQMYAGIRICRMLNDETYKGNDYYPQIVDTDTYNTVQNMLKSKKHKAASNKNKEFWCKGLLVYEDTNETFVVRSHNQCYQTTHSYKKISAKRLHEVMTNMMNEYYKDNQKTEIELISEITKRIQLLYRKLYSLEQESTELIQKKDKIWERNIEGKLSDAKAEQMSKRIIEQELEIRKKKHEISDEIDKLKSTDVESSDIDFNSYSNEQKFEEIHNKISIVYVKVKGLGEKTLIVHFKDKSIKVINLNKKVN